MSKLDVNLQQFRKGIERLRESLALEKSDLVRAERDIQEGRISENEEVFDRVIKTLRNGLGKPQDA